jgi:ABC-type amino acid transport substrate-binding protein/serine phosphatase RsbU (regulator of sigma subunit)
LLITNFIITNSKGNSVVNSLLFFNIDRIQSHKNSIQYLKNLTREEKEYIKNKKTITIANNSAIVPFDYNVEGIPQGYSVEYLQKLFKYTGLNIKFVNGPQWNNFIDMIKNNTIDLMHVADDTPKRREFAIFSKPYMQNKNYFLTHKNVPTIKSIKDLYGKTVVIVKGWAVENYLKENYPQIKTLSVDTNQECYEYVLNNKAYATIDYDLSAKFMVNRKGFYQLKLSGWFKEFDNNQGIDNHFMTNKQNKHLISIINKALDTFPIEERKKLTQKWFGKQDLEFIKESVVHDEIVFSQASFIMQLFGFIFLCIIVLVLLYWIIKGRPKSFTIQQTFLFFYILFAGLIITTGIMIMVLLDSETKQEQIENMKKELLTYSKELQNTTQNLSSFSRSYIATKDDKFRVYHENIVQVFKGIKPYPKKYTTDYWYKVLTQRPIDGHSKNKVNYEQKVNEFPLMQNEKSKINAALKALKKLIKIQYIAINATNGYFMDSNGEFTQQGSTNNLMANEILHNLIYQELKFEVFTNLEKFDYLINTRFKNNLHTEHAKNKASLLVITFLIVITIIFAIIGYFITQRKIVKPILYLKDSAERIKDGNYRNSINITNKDELGDLANMFNSMSNSINQRNQQLSDAKLEVELVHKRTQDSIQYASLIQNVLIPDKKLFAQYFKEHFTIWEPKDIVGGDIYLFEQLRNEDECLIFVIDCTGHGVPGAFLTMLVKAIERQISLSILNSNKEVNTAQILTKFNQSMKHLLKQDNDNCISNVGFDGQVLYYNKKDNIVKCSSARNEIFYVQDNTLHTIKPDKCSIGYKETSQTFQFTEHIIDVSQETTLYISTDGYWDQLGGEKERSFGKRRLKELLLEIQNDSLENQKEKLLYRLANYQANYPRIDDITFIGIKV